ncbi:unnamed protein product, partial [marine sediment metagenome]
LAPAGQEQSARSAEFADCLVLESIRSSVGAGGT